MCFVCGDGKIVCLKAMLMITQADPPTVQKPELSSDAFNKFVARCLKKDQNERPSAAELLEDPLFLDKNHLKVLMMMMAEYKILTRTKSSGKGSSGSSSSPGTSSHPGNSGGGGIGGGHSTGSTLSGDDLTESEVLNSLSLSLSLSLS